MHKVKCIKSVMFTAALLWRLDHCWLNGGESSLCSYEVCGIISRCSRSGYYKEKQINLINLRKQQEALR